VKTFAKSLEIRAKRTPNVVIRKECCLTLAESYEDLFSGGHSKKRSSRENICTKSG